MDQDDSSKVAPETDDGNAVLLTLRALLCEMRAIRRALAPAPSRKGGNERVEEAIASAGLRLKVRR